MSSQAIIQAQKRNHYFTHTTVQVLVINRQSSFPTTVAHSTGLRKIMMESRSSNNELLFQNRRQTYNVQPEPNKKLPQRTELYMYN